MQIKSFERIKNKSEEEKQEELYKLIENYETLVELNLKILRELLKNENNKSIIVYYTGLVIELVFKMIILKSGISIGERIGDYEHHISKMYDDILKKSMESDIKNICMNIKDRAALINYSDGKTVQYDEYTNFRYNHRKEKLNLIFTEKINEREKKHVEEVIECIELIMK